MSRYQPSLNQRMEYILNENRRMQMRLDALERANSMPNQQQRTGPRKFFRKRAGARVAKRQLHAVKKELEAERLQNEVLRNVPLTNVQGNNVHGNFIIHVSSNPELTMNNNETITNKNSNRPIEYRPTHSGHDTRNKLSNVTNNYNRKNSSQNVSNSHYPRNVNRQYRGERGGKYRGYHLGNNISHNAARSQNKNPDIKSHNNHSQSHTSDQKGKENRKAQSSKSTDVKDARHYIKEKQKRE